MGRDREHDVGDNDAGLDNAASGRFDPPTAAGLRLKDVWASVGEGKNPAMVLRGINLCVQQGEMVALTGRTGAGKSTLISVAAGLLSPTSGSVWVMGEAMTGSETRRASIRRRHIALVFQRLNLVASLTAGENVALPLELGGHKPYDARVAASRALAEVDLAGVERRFPHELSGGQQQKVAIARALVGDNRVLLADEPTAALDDLSAEDMLGLLRRCCNQGATAVMVTHSPSLAAWADRVIRLSSGLAKTESGPTIPPRDVAGLVDS